jgi:4-hydroxythreonine-4-phosphate dehydrogenase
MKAGPPLVGITMGDPAGVGPEIIVKALNRWGRRQRKRARVLVIGDPGTLKRALDVVNSPADLHVVEYPRQAFSVEEGIPILPATDEDLSHVEWGRLTPSAGRAQIDFLRRAVDLALRAEIQAVVTAPIHKVGIKLAGLSFPGHTEMLAQWTGASHYAMMVAGPRLRVVPVTLHQPIMEAVSRLDVESISRTIHLTHCALKEWFGVPHPRIAVAGLNPHAGDQGLFGLEEVQIIEPAVKSCCSAGMMVEGPFPPDSVFRMAAEGRFDAVVAMYHDQGLIPVKLIHPHEAVNLTLGLPIIRTSVDHGTAYDIAGKGIASEQSLLTALGLAEQLSRRATVLPGGVGSP